MQFSQIGDLERQPVFSPCFNFFVVFSSGNVSIIDARSCESETLFQVNLKIEGKSANQPICKIIRFSPDSKYFTVKIGKQIKIYTLKGELKREIWDSDNEIDDFFWSENPNKHQMIISFKKFNRYEIFDLNNKEVAIIENVKDFASRNYAFTKSPHIGQYMAVLERKRIQWKAEKPNDFVGLYSTATLICEGCVKLDTKKTDKIQFTKYGELILIGERNFLDVHVINFQKKKTRSLFQEKGFIGVSVHKLSLTGELLGIGTYYHSVYLFDTKTWEKIGEIKIEDNLKMSESLTLQREENGQFAVLRKGTHLLERKKQGHQINASLKAPVFNPINRLEFSPQDKFLAVQHSSFPKYLFIYNLSGLKLLTVIQTQKNITDFKWIESSGFYIHNLCIAAGKNGVLVWRSNSFEGDLFQIMLPIDEIKVSHIEMGKDGRMILYSKGQKKYVSAYCNPSQPDWPECDPYTQL